ncbi:MAG: glycosyltransferase family 2 protein [Verrucomicrobiota bacterium]
MATLQITPPESPDQVSVIVVTYNSASCIRACLESVLAQQGVTVEIAVVDNASQDDTVGVVRDFGTRVNLMANQDNAGFGRGCNQGFAASSGQFIYFLNPDARLVQPDALAALVHAIRSHPHWGMAATRVVSATGKDESPPSPIYPGQTHAKNDFARLPGRIAWVIGASMFIRRDVLAALNGFDPDFFLYSEETDLCLRLRKLGHEIGFLNEVTVRHIGAVSERGCDPYAMWTRKMEGLHLFWRKHFSPGDTAHLVRRDLRRARFRLLLNGILAALQPPHSTAWQKQRRYLAVRNTSLRFLSSSE